MMGSGSGARASSTEEEEDRRGAAFSSNSPCCAVPKEKGKPAFARPGGRQSEDLRDREAPAHTSGPQYLNMAWQTVLGMGRRAVRICPAVFGLISNSFFHQAYVSNLGGRRNALVTNCVCLMYVLTSYTVTYRGLRPKVAYTIHHMD